jgi:predicted ATPase
LGLWTLGYPDAAFADAECALKEARSIEQAATLMFTLPHTGLTHIFCGNYTALMAQVHESIVLAEEKGAQVWKAGVMVMQGRVFAATGRTSQGIEMLTAGITGWRATGTTIYLPLFLYIWRKPMPKPVN